MFGFFKKRKNATSAEQLTQRSELACSEVKEKWLYFHDTVHLKADVPLAQKIDMFSPPISQFFQNKYPDLLTGGSEIFWLTTFTAILESGTHPKEEINAAISQLRSKYSPQGRIDGLKEALHSFVDTASSCAYEMEDNSLYVQRELQNVVMTDELRDLTKRICVSLQATSDAATKELQSWLNDSPEPQELAQRANAITNLLFRDMTEMHGLVMALRAQSEIDQRFSLGSMLVGESTTNILNAYNRAADSAKKVAAAARA